MEQSGLEPWPGTLGCDPGKDTKLSQSLSPARFFWHPIQGGCRHAPDWFMLQKPEISAGLMSHLAREQTLPVWLLYQAYYPEVCWLQMPRVNRPFSSNFTIKTTMIIFSLRPTTLSKHLLWSWNIAWQARWQEDEKRFTTHISDIYFFWMPCITQVKSRINCRAVCVSTLFQV